jgi:hypothetical protein
MCHQTVAIGFQTAPQALKRRLDMTDPGWSQR